MPLTLNVGGNDFLSQIQAVADKLQETIQDAIVGYANGLYLDLVSTTPIATGQARANWQIGLNEASSDQFLPGGKSLHLPQRVDWQAYVSAGISTISDFKSGDTIYITNSAPYIIALNNGRSPQGSGFIEAALANAALLLTDLSNG